MTLYPVGGWSYAHQIGTCLWAGKNGFELRRGKMRGFAPKLRIFGEAALAEMRKRSEAIAETAAAPLLTCKAPERAEGNGLT